MDINLNKLEFNDICDVQDFIYFVEVIKGLNFDDATKSIHDEYKKLSLGFTHSMQKYYESFDLGFRDYLSRVAIVN